MRLIYDMPTPYSMTEVDKMVDDAVRAAVAAEREACVADVQSYIAAARAHCKPGSADAQLAAAEEIIEIISARGARSTAKEIDRLRAAVAAEREACAQLVHDRLGADGYGVAVAIRARKGK